ncbi:unnamed protein product [Rhodiola kirilowii]
MLSNGVSAIRVRGFGMSCNLALQRLSLMKPQRLHQLAGMAMQSGAKRPKVMSGEESAMKDTFGKYAEYLNELRLGLNMLVSYACGIVGCVIQNDKRERLVKASRDITMNSKKVIFQVHRISKDNKDEVLEKAEKDLKAVMDQHIARLLKELNGTDFWKLRRAYSPGVQEFIEAATFCRFCKTGTLLKLEEINADLLPLSGPSIEPLQINILDYLLGLADLTGELMRLAMGRISEGELEFAGKICEFVREIYRELTLVVPKMDDNSDMVKKMDVMLQSAVKIENACYSVHVRGSEYIPLLGSNDPSYSVLGVPEIDL